MGIFQFGGDALEQSLQKEASRLRLGQGALGAALCNLALLPSLLVPQFFSCAQILMEMHEIGLFVRWQHDYVGFMCLETVAQLVLLFVWGTRRSTDF